jgi:hypothetical protein
MSKSLTIENLIKQFLEEKKSEKSSTSQSRKKNPDVSQGDSTNG